MIAPNFRLKFKNDLGENYQYTPKVKKLLEAAKITNRKGEAYSSQSIRNIFNGEAANEDIEFAILECYDNAMSLKQKREHLINKYKVKTQEPN